MRQDDSAELLSPELPFSGLDYSAGAGVKEYLGAAQVEPQAARGQNLVGDHYPGAGRAQKGYGFGWGLLIFHSRYKL